MQNEPNLNPENREMAELLGSCRPVDHGIDRDDLLFRAGAAAARRSAWLWRGTAGALAAGLALVVFLRPAAAPATQNTVYVDRVVEHREFIPIAATPPAPASGQLAMRIDPAEFRLRQQIIAHGADALPRQASAAPADESIGDTLGVPRSALGAGKFFLK